MRSLDDILTDAGAIRDATDVRPPHVRAQAEQLAAGITDHLRRKYHVDLHDRRDAHTVAAFIDYLLHQASHNVKTPPTQDAVAFAAETGDVFVRLLQSTMDSLIEKHRTEETSR